MKPRHAEGYRTNARAILIGCNIRIGQDFHTLSINQVAALDAAADQAKYQAPRNANGSRCRYFHDLIQRRAQWRPGDKS